MITVGVSGGFGHDAAAALAIDGHVVAMVEEERLCGQKHAVGRSAGGAVGWCLAETGIRPGEVDRLVLSWDPALEPSDPALRCRADDILGDPVWGGRPPRSEVVAHHLAHAASAARCSGWPRSVVLVVDGNGEDVATTVWHDVDGTLHRMAAWPTSQSLGHFYNAVTRHVGLGSSEAAGKLMGLASYGSPERIGDLPCTQEADGYRLLVPTAIDELEAPARYAALRRHWAKELERLAGPPATAQEWVGDAVPPRLADLAAWAQATVERCVVDTIAAWTERLGCRHVAIAGGVGLNCTTNGRVAQSGLVDALFVQPAAGDAGGALGAALLGTEAAPRTAFEVDLGPGPATAAAVDEARRLGHAVERLDAPHDIAVELLLSGMTIGWVQGRAEIGPRALGRRSMLAIPSPVSVRAHVNHQKSREWWRPLSPSVGGAEASRLPLPSPHMLLAMDAPADWLDRAPAVVHVDGSCRPQTVNATHPLGELVDAVGRATGTPILLNTSLNIRGEPTVVDGPRAVHTLARSGIDAVIIEDALVRR